MIASVDEAACRLTKRVITRQGEAVPADEVVKIIDGAVASHDTALIAIVPPFELAPR